MKLKVNTMEAVAGKKVVALVEVIEKLDVAEVDIEAMEATLVREDIVEVAAVDMGIVNTNLETEAIEIMTDLQEVVVTVVEEGEAIEIEVIIR